MSTTPKSQLTTLVPVILAIAAGAMGIYWFQAPERKATSTDETKIVSPGGVLPKSLASGALAAFLIHTQPKDMPNLAFTAADGAAKTLTQWQGKVVLINLWATWCAPCRKEMPDLGKLQATLGSDAFEVVAISVDRKGAEASRAFLKEAGAENLALYVDPTAKVLADLQALGLPATVLVGRNGKELGRLLGPADWSGAEAQALIKAALAQTP